MPVICPNASDLNRTPTSIGWSSPESTWAGVVVPQIEQLQETLRRTPPVGCSMLPLSSVALTRMTLAGLPYAAQENLLAVVPVAGCQVRPSSVETSTPATTPPPASLDVPEMV